jgi:hypothetical protein
MAAKTELSVYDPDVVDLFHDIRHKIIETFDAAPNFEQSLPCKQEFLFDNRKENHANSLNETRIFVSVWLPGERSETLFHQGRLAGLGNFLLVSNWISNRTIKANNSDELRSSYEFFAITREDASLGKLVSLRDRIENPVFNLENEYPQHIDSVCSIEHINEFVCGAISSLASAIVSIRQLEI